MKNLMQGLQTEIENLTTLVSELKTISSAEVPDIDRIISDIEGTLLQLKQEEARVLSILESTSIAFWDWNIPTGETVFNERWADIIGYSLEEISPVTIDTWMQHAHPKDFEQSKALMEAHWRGETDYYIHESRVRHKQGHWVWVLDTGKVVEWDNQGNPLRMVGTHVDISSQKLTQLELRDAKQEAEQAIEALSEQAMQLQSEVARRRNIQEKLDHMAQYDSLTNLPNRSLLFHQGDKVLASARRYGHNVAIMFIDLDGFEGSAKNTYQHLSDSVLVEMSLRLIDVIREVDTVSRVGDEEFVILLSHWQQRSDLETIANRILTAINKPIESLQPDQTLNANIGIAVYPDDAGYFKDLLTLADKALSNCKNGAQQFCFSS